MASIRDRIIDHPSHRLNRWFLSVLGYQKLKRLVPGDKYPTSDGVSDYTSAGGDRLVQAVAGRALAVALNSHGVRLEADEVFNLLICIKPLPELEQEAVHDEGHGGYITYRKKVPEILVADYGQDPHFAAQCVLTGHTASEQISQMLESDNDSLNVVALVAYLTNASIGKGERILVSLEERWANLIQTWVADQSKVAERSPMDCDLEHFVEVARRVIDWFRGQTDSPWQRILNDANALIEEWYPDEL